MLARLHATVQDLHPLHFLRSINIPHLRLETPNSFELDEDFPPSAPPLKSIRPTIAAEPTVAMVPKNFRRFIVATQTLMVLQFYLEFLVLYTQI